MPATNGKSKEVKSKIGSMDNSAHKPGGGNVCALFILLYCICNSDDYILL